MPALAEHAGVRNCQQCGESFSLRPFAHHQLFCSDRCRWRHRDQNNPKCKLRNRERCRAWAAEHRNVRNANPWLCGAPVYGDNLPGGAVQLFVTPRPKWAIELRNTRALHGMVTGLVGLPHTKPVPQFSLVPTTGGVGWGVIVREESTALGLACKMFDAVLFDRTVSVRCGPMVRIKTPVVTKRGRRKLRIDAVTPVCVRNSSSHWTHVIPTSGNLTSTLLHHLPMRLGISLTNSDLMLELVSRETAIETTPLGGKYGNVAGWVGSCIVETNATGEWLLRCATSLGLGGRSAFGFGRVRVAPV